MKAIGPIELRRANNGYLVLLPRLGEDRGYMRSDDEVRVFEEYATLERFLRDWANAECAAQGQRAEPKPRV